MHIDGVKSEEYVLDFLMKELNQENVFLCHQPFDIWIKGAYLEVKSTKLYIKKSKKEHLFQHGRYECWNDSQMIKLTKNEIWVCFVIQHDHQFIIHGFCKSTDLPKKRRFALNAIQHIPLYSCKQFISYMRKRKHE